MIPCSCQDHDGAPHATERAARDRADGSLPGQARPDRRSEPRAREARPCDRLALPRGALRGGLRGWARPAAPGHATDGGARDLEAPARPLRRGLVRTMDREPVLPALLRRGVLPAQTALRPLLA